MELFALLQAWEDALQRDENLLESSEGGTEPIQCPGWNELDHFMKYACSGKCSEVSLRNSFTV